jgi:hypothetical protein
MGVAVTDTIDLADRLAGEFEHLYTQALLPSGDHAIRFSGVTPQQKQFILELPTSYFEPAQRREFCLWLCRKEALSAYAYCEPRIFLNDKRLGAKGVLDIVCASKRKDLCRSVAIGAVNVSEPEPGLIAAWRDLLHTNERIETELQIVYSNLWEKIRPKVLWRQR